jgi:hypothetical protein
MALDKQPCLARYDKRRPAHTDTDHSTDHDNPWKIVLNGYFKPFLELFNIVDRMIQLPSNLNENFLHAIHAIEEDKHLPHINTAERVGVEKGIEQGIQRGGMEGRPEVMRETARNLIAVNHLTDAQIAQATGLLEHEVAALRSATDTE